MKLTEDELAYILHELGKFFYIKEIRDVMRLLASIKKDIDNNEEDSK